MFNLPPINLDNILSQMEEGGNLVGLSVTSSQEKNLIIYDFFVILYRFFRKEPYLEGRDMKRIKITAGEVSLEAELLENKTAQMIWDALPIESKVNTWGEEIYFRIPVKAKLDETAREVVEVGDLGYWPPGSALCIFFGPTPGSREDQIKPASAVNIVGKVIGDPKTLKGVREGVTVKVERTD